MINRILAFLISFCLIFEQTGFAQLAIPIGIPGYLSLLAPVADKFRPIHLRSIDLSSGNGNFELILDKGDLKDIQPRQLEETTKELYRYFQIGLALPNKYFWVNLRPDSPDSMIEPLLAKTDLGKVMLEADLQLKKDLANFTSLQTPEGKLYWDKLYSKASELYNQQDIQIPTLTRPWIVPGEVVIRSSQTGAFVYKATLKVMLEQDYIKDSPAYNFNDPRLKELNGYSSQLIRELIIPKLTREVNSSRRYSQLRQVYYSLILAQWFKSKSFGVAMVEGRVAMAQKTDSQDLSGLTSKTSWSKDTYFQAYKKSFQKGEYNQQEQVNSLNGISIRQYTSGGIQIMDQLKIQEIPGSVADFFTGNQEYFARLSMNSLTGDVNILPASPVLKSGGAQEFDGGKKISQESEKAKDAKRGNDQAFSSVREKFMLLTEAEKEELNRRLRELHQDSLSQTSLNKEESDREFYTITIREQRRFIAVFLDKFCAEIDLEVALRKEEAAVRTLGYLFSKIAGLFAKYLSKKKEIGKNRLEAVKRREIFDRAWQEASRIYLDMFPQPEKRTWNAPANVPAIYAEAYDKLQSCLTTDIPALFLYSLESRDSLDRAFELYQRNNPQVIVERVICTPDSDRMQLIGADMPVSAQDREFSKEKIRFQKGVLYRLVDQAKADPSKIFVLRLEQVEALSAKVWVQLNQFLLTGELWIPETNEKLILPDNLKIVASLSSGLRDSAFYDRFLRKQLNIPDRKSLVDYAVTRFGLPQVLIEEYCNLQADNSDKITMGQLLVLFSYMKGRLADENISANSQRGRAIITEERDLFFRSMARGKENILLAMGKKEEEPGGGNDPDTEMLNEVLEFSTENRLQITADFTPEEIGEIVLKYPADWKNKLKELKLIKEEERDLFFLARRSNEGPLKGINPDDETAMMVLEYGGKIGEVYSRMGELRTYAGLHKIDLSLEEARVIAILAPDQIEGILKGREDVSEVLMLVEMRMAFQSVITIVPGVKNVLVFEPKTGRFMADGVELPIRSELKDKIAEAMKTRDMEQAIREVFKAELGLTLTQDVARTLSAISRNYRYGTRVLRLEGPTGTGKTFMAQALAKMLDIPFYGEPFHAASKQSKLLGALKPDEKADYYMDSDTPFLQILEKGGVVALSELNAAVKDDKARFGWLMVPLARGDEKFILNQYPDGKETTRELTRHPDSMVIIDINPTESYEARGQLPGPLNEVTPAVWVEGRFESQELEDISGDYLAGLAQEDLDYYRGKIAGLHFAIQQELADEDGPWRQEEKEKREKFGGVDITQMLKAGRMSPMKAMKVFGPMFGVKMEGHDEEMAIQKTLAIDAPHIISLRELKRACRMIAENNGKLSREQNLIEAVMFYYGFAFKEIGDQERVERFIRRILAPSAPKWEPPIAIEKFVASGHRVICLVLDPEGADMQELRKAMKNNEIDKLNIERINGWVPLEVAKQGKIVNAEKEYPRLRATIEQLFENDSESFEKSIGFLITLKKQNKPDQGVVVSNELDQKLQELKSAAEQWAGSGNKLVKPWEMLDMIEKEQQRKSGTTVEVMAKVLAGKPPSISKEFAKKLLELRSRPARTSGVAEEIEKELKETPPPFVSSGTNDIPLRTRSVREDIRDWGTNPDRPIVARPDMKSDEYGVMVMDVDGTLIGSRLSGVAEDIEKELIKLMRSAVEPATGVPVDWNQIMLKYLKEPEPPLAEFQDKGLQYYLDYSLFRTKEPTLLSMDAVNDPMAQLRSAAEKRGRVVIEKLNTNLFTDDFTLFGGYIPDSEREAETGEAQLRLADGAMSRFIAQAAKAREEDKNLPEAERRIFVLAFENYHYLRPQIAVALNVILQERVYYPPTSTDRIELPDNLRFFATATNEAEFNLSLAEQSRWARIFFHKPNGPAPQADNDLYSSADPGLAGMLPTVAGGAMPYDNDSISAKDLMRMARVDVEGMLVNKPSRPPSDSGSMTTAGGAMLDILTSASELAEKYLKDAGIKIKIEDNGKITLPELREMKYKRLGSLEEKLKGADDKEISSFAQDDLVPRFTADPKLEQLIEDYCREFPAVDKEEVRVAAEAVAKKKGPGEEPVTIKEVQYTSAEELRNAYKIEPFERQHEPLAEEELMVPTNELLRQESMMVNAMNRGQVIICEGEPGGGKTDMGIDIAERLGLDSYIYSGHAGAHLRDFIGAYTKDEKGRFVLTCLPDKDGHFKVPFLEFYTHGGVYTFDEGALGKYPQALISWLTGIARGEQELVINEHPGQEPLRLKRHKHFHIVITTNPVDETPGRESISVEVLKAARRIWVENKLSDASYQAILDRFYDFYSRQSKVELIADRDGLIGLNIALHKLMQKFVSDEVTLENPERHLLTMRDMRGWVKAFMSELGKGVLLEEAFMTPFELFYLKQFSPEAYALAREQVDSLLLNQEIAKVFNKKALKESNGRPLKYAAAETIRTTPSKTIKSGSAGNVKAQANEQSLIAHEWTGELKVSKEDAVMTDERLKSLQELVASLSFPESSVHFHYGDMAILKGASGEDVFVYTEAGSIMILRKNSAGRFERTEIKNSLQGSGRSFNAFLNERGLLTVVTKEFDSDKITLTREMEPDVFRSKTIQVNGIDHFGLSFKAIQDLQGKLVFADTNEQKSVITLCRERDNFIPKDLMFSGHDLCRRIDLLEDAQGKLTIAVSGEDTLAIMQEKNPDEFEVRELRKSTLSNGQVQLMRDKESKLIIAAVGMLSGTGPKDPLPEKKDGLTILREEDDQTFSESRLEGKIYGSFDAMTDEEGFLSIVSYNPERHSQAGKEELYNSPEIALLKEVSLDEFTRKIMKRPEEKTVTNKVNIFRDQDGSVSFVSGHVGYINIWKDDEAQFTAFGAADPARAKPKKFASSEVVKHTSGPIATKNIGALEVSDVKDYSAGELKTKTVEAVSAVGKVENMSSSVLRELKFELRIEEYPNFSGDKIRVVRDEQGLLTIVTISSADIAIWRQNAEGGFEVSMVKGAQDNWGTQMRVVPGSDGLLYIVTEAEKDDGLKVWQEIEKNKFRITILPRPASGRGFDAFSDDKGGLTIVNSHSRAQDEDSIKNGDSTFDIWEIHKDGSCALRQGVLPAVPTRKKVFLLWAGRDPSGRLQFMCDDPANSNDILICTEVQKDRFSIELLRAGNEDILLAKGAFRDGAGKLNIFGRMSKQGPVLFDQTEQGKFVQTVLDMPLFGASVAVTKNSWGLYSLGVNSKEYESSIGIESKVSLIAQGQDKEFRVKKFRLRENFDEIIAFVDEEGYSTFVSSHEGVIRIWKDDEERFKKAPEPLPDEQEEFVDKGLTIGSEEQVKADLSRVFEYGAHGLLLLEPGAREHQIIREFGKENGYQLLHLESVPEMTDMEIIGGLFPILEDEPRDNGREFRVKPGFLSRHLVPEEQRNEPGKKKLLILHNIDALPERVRAALNNFLIKGYLEIKDDSGRSKRYYLPSGTDIVATISSKSQREFSSAFFNRFVKIYVPSIKVFHRGFSELLQLLMFQCGLSEYEARQLQKIYIMVKALEEGGQFWPSGTDYNFTAKDALLLGEFVRLARQEAGGQLGRKDMERLIVQEALRAYGGRLCEHEEDYTNFVDLILKNIFDHEVVEELSGEVLMEEGRLLALSGVNLPAGSRGLAWDKTDPRYRLTLVPTITRTMSGILRGWQAGRMVSIVGETGVAKTTMGVFLSQLLFGASNGMEHYYIYSTHGESKARDMTVQLRMNREGAFRLEMQEFLKRVKAGNQVIIVDEANMRPEMLWVLNGIARGEKEVSVEIPGEEPFTVEIGDNVYILLTMNPESYTDRGEVPGVLLENVFRLWAPARYAQDEVIRILNDLIDASQQAAVSKRLSLIQARSTLSGAAALVTLEDFIKRVDEIGFDNALEERTIKELRKLERDILAMESVRKKMNKVRSGVAVAVPKTRIIFSILTWWGSTDDRTTIIVPLHELANSKRTPETIIGIVLHEARHQLYSLSHPEMEKVAEPEHLQIVKKEEFHNFWNGLEDVRINYINDPVMAGERAYIKASLDEMCKDLTQEQISEMVKNYEFEMDNIFLFELVFYGRTGRYRNSFASLPEPMQQALRSVIEKNGAEQSLLDQVTNNEQVLPDMAGIQQGKKDFAQERLRSGKVSLGAMCAKIWPIYEKLLKQADENREKAGKKKEGKGGRGKGGGKGSGGQRDGMPSFGRISREELEDLIENTPLGALPESLRGGRSGGRPGRGNPAGQDDAGGGEGSEGDGSEGDNNDDNQSGRPNFMNDEDRDKDADNDLDRKINEAKNKRTEEMKKNEPLNYALSNIPAASKRLADGLVQLFRVPDEPDIEESPSGWKINPVRYLLRNMNPFDEEEDRPGKPDLAFGVTIDLSGSMQGYFKAIKDMNALFMATFQKIGRKKIDYSMGYENRAFGVVKAFDEKLGQSELNRKYGEFGAIIDARGRPEDIGGEGIHLYVAVCGVIDKYKATKKKNKIEIIITDGQDMGGDLSYDMSGRPIPSFRLKRKLDEARHLGIEIVGVGFNTRDTEVFGKWVQLDANQADAVVEALLKIARRKALSGKLPDGNLVSALNINLNRSWDKSRADGGSEEAGFRYGQNDNVQTEDFGISRTALSTQQLGQMERGDAVITIGSSKEWREANESYAGFVFKNGTLMRSWAAGKPPAISGVVLAKSLVRAQSRQEDKSGGAVSKYSDFRTDLESYNRRFSPLLGTKIEEYVIAQVRKTKQIMRILDWGCGEGVALVELLKRLPEDVRPMVKLYGFSNMYFDDWKFPEAAGIDFILDDGQNIGSYFGGELPIDMVISNLGLCHVEDIAYLEKIGAIMKDEGILLTDAVYDEQTWEDWQKSARQLFEINFDKRATRLMAKKKSTSRPVGQDGGTAQTDDLGGIDFRQIPVAGESAVTTALTPQLQQLAQNSKMADLDQEWSCIRGEMLAPQMPYGKIREYIAVCLSRPGCRKKLDQAVTCIIDILRMEEDQALATNQELKDILMYLS
ncbi:MAG: AAA family ATPase [Candidatus Omnitrophica bacterium]|nr:AAA family ATPase [Candidatus Omnitrophota bacterium]